MGKSRLVEELLGDARVYDFLSLKSAGREEGGQIYGALIDAFHGMADLMGGETDKFSVMERWLQVLKRMRQQKPIVFCLEDIQWLDELNIGIFAVCVARSRTVSVFVMLDLPMV